MAQLDAETKKELGVGLNAIGMLLDAQPGTVYPADAIALQSRRKALDELASEEYVTIREVKTGSGTFIVVERTKKGAMVADILIR